MESNRHPGTAVVSIAFALAVVLAVPAAAVERGRDASAQTKGDGVDVIFTRNGDGSITGRGGDGACQWKATPFLSVTPSFPEIAVPPNDEPDASLYLVSCGDGPISLRWLAPRQVADATARSYADELVRRLTVGNSNIGVRPEARGVTGIPSMFWVEGFGAQPRTATESAFGLTVTVDIQLVGVDWDFGDGTPVVHGGLGEAWPQPSSVQHTYRDSSGGRPYRVTATLRFQPSYTVNGVAGAPLGPIEVPTTRDYVVHQIQAERTR